MTNVPKVPFGDLKRTYENIRADVDSAMQRVANRGWFVLGEEGEAFEREFATYVGAPFCVSCNSGTDAINLALRAHGIGKDSTVLTVPNTCVPTIAGIHGSGALVNLCDADEITALLSPEALESVLEKTEAAAVVPVHLYGQPCDIDGINAVAGRHGAVVIEDAAQAHGATYKGKRIGADGNTVCWSFYPSKNLGAFGDAGAITTYSEEVAEKLRMLRNYGQTKRYYHSMQGINSRMDEIQAAILRARLPRLDSENSRRRQIAQRYRTEIKNPDVQFIQQRADGESSEHLFVIRHKDRDGLLNHLARAGVQAFIHYPVPVHVQEAYKDLGYSGGSFPAAERLCGLVISLPMFPELTDTEANTVIAAVNEYRV